MKTGDILMDASEWKMDEDLVEALRKVSGNEKKSKVQIHKELCLELNEIYKRKNNDYGDSFGLSFKEEGMAMPRIRLGDKFNRFKTLSRVGNKQMVDDEGIIDTLMDLANYAIMTIVELEAEKNDN